jgi:hypothetical protein
VLVLAEWIGWIRTGASARHYSAIAPATIHPDQQAEPDSRALPDYLPARMMAKFCPRLFYEQVEGFRA